MDEKKFNVWVEALNEHAGVEEVFLLNRDGDIMFKNKDFPFSNEEEYEKFYSECYPPQNEDYKFRGFNRRHGEKVFKSYGLAGIKRLLDVGCGGGSVVSVCRMKGVEAYGCEMVRYFDTRDDSYIYYRKFEDIHFPTDHFDGMR